MATDNSVSSVLERPMTTPETPSSRILELGSILELLVHASSCTRRSACQLPLCPKLKGLLRHGTVCQTRVTGGCNLCKRMWYLLQLHAKSCQLSESCGVPRCRDLKVHIRQLLQERNDFEVGEKEINDVREMMSNLEVNDSS